MVLKGEPLLAGTPWPPSLLAALRHWGVTQPKAPCLTALDTAGKVICTLTYGKCASRPTTSDADTPLMDKLAAPPSRAVATVWMTLCVHSERRS